MATVKELETTVLLLQQSVANLSATVDTYRTEFREALMKVKDEAKQEVIDYLRSTTTPLRPPTPRGKPLPMEWRMESVKDFLNWRSTVKPNHEPGGNVYVGDRLKAELGRDAGYAEGQLYINWCTRVTREHVRQFWQSRGFDDIPEGL